MHISKSHVLFCGSFFFWWWYSSKNNFPVLLRLNDFTIKLYFPPPIAVYSSTSRDTLNQPFVLMGFSLLNSRGVLLVEYQEPSSVQPCLFSEKGNAPPLPATASPACFLGACNGAMDTN